MINSKLKEPSNKNQKQVEPIQNQISQFKMKLKTAEFPGYETYTRKQVAIPIYSNNFDPERIVFSKVYEKDIRDSSTKASYFQMFLGYANHENKTISDMNLVFDEMFSFGVQEYKNEKSSSYSMTFCLHDKEGDLTERQKITIENLNKYKDRVAKFITSSKFRKLGNAKFQQKVARKMTSPTSEKVLDICRKIIKYKEEVVFEDDPDSAAAAAAAPKYAPTRSGKLIQYYSKNGPDSFGTRIFNKNERTKNNKPKRISDQDLIESGQYLTNEESKNFFHATPVIRDESLFFGQMFTLQSRITEVIINKKSNEGESMLINMLEEEGEFKSGSDDDDDEDGGEGEEDYDQVDLSDGE